MEKFFEELADILDVDEVNAEDILEDFDEYEDTDLSAGENNGADGMGIYFYQGNNKAPAYVDNGRLYIDASSVNANYEHVYFTAGLNWTPELLEKARVKGVKTAFVTLHVGLGTFRPVKEEEITDHVMHSERYHVSEEAAARINAARQRGSRVICVGTTSCRTIESTTDENHVTYAGSGSTNIFIYPGYQFKGLDAIITNFHLPESTLIMLISAFSSREKVLAAYEEAVRERYRFFSFGDAMFIY